MDDSQQYIKMCFGAWPDLKGNYQPAKGDFYKCSCKSCQNTDRIFMINDYDYDYVTNRNLKNVYKGYAEMVKDSSYGGFGAHWDEGGKEKRGFFIIWKQDQLQEIFEEGGRKLRYIELLGIVSIIKERNDSYYVNFQSLEQLWLSFVMFQKFGKVWNSDKEEWVKEKGGML